MSTVPPPSFETVGLLPTLLQALREEGYTRPTPIQAKAIPHILTGRDVLGCAQTGTGKTAAFALPILQRLSTTAAKPAAPAAAGAHGGHGTHSAARAAAHRPIRALILSPTRELAAQIGDSFTAYGRYTNLRHTVIYGGVGQHPQEVALHRGVDIVVATPGRLCDLMEQHLVDLRSLEVLVLDEADRMLDMGFLPDVRRIEAACPEHRQTLFFSATLGPAVLRVSHSFIRDPIKVEVAPNATPIDLIEQKLYRVDRNDKIDLLMALLEAPDLERVIVFTRTKHGADKVERRLHESGLETQAIHGNKTQGARQRALDDFKAGHIRVLVATDIAARGIDVDNVTHVINFDMPVEPEAYVHRIGRTGRAEAAGVAISFCTMDEREELRAIEKLIRIEIPLIKAETILEGRPRSAPLRSSHGREHRRDPAPRGGHRQGGGGHGERAPRHGSVHAPRQRERRHERPAREGRGRIDARPERPLGELYDERSRRDAEHAQHDEPAHPPRAARGAHPAHHERSSHERTSHERTSPEREPRESAGAHPRHDRRDHPAPRRHEGHGRGHERPDLPDYRETGRETGRDTGRDSRHEPRRESAAGRDSHEPREPRHEPRDAHDDRSRRSNNNRRFR